MKVIKFSEHILVSLGLLAVMMAGVFILLNFAAKNAPQPVSGAANTLAGYASGSAFGY